MPDTVKETESKSAAATKAVSDAVKAAGIENQETEETVEETPIEETAEETVVEDKAPTELEKRTERALRLLDQLEDDVAGPALIKEIATNIGLIEKAETKTEVKAATKKVEALREKVKSKLSDFPILAESIADILEEIVDEQKSQFTAELVSRDKARIAQEVGDRTDRFIKTNKVTEAEQEEILKLVNKFPPNPTVPPEEYLAYHLEHVRKQDSKKSASEKIKANLANRPASRGSGNGSESVIRKTPISPREAVEMAMRGESAE